MKHLNKKILVFGLANKQSIAWGIIQKLHKEGAKIGICYFHDSNKKRVTPLAEEINCDFVIETDVSKDEDLKKLLMTVKEKWGQFDGLVHSIAFAPTSAFSCRFHETSKEDFFQTLDISAFSLMNIVHHLRDTFAPEFSAVSMSYLGAQKVLPGYNVMGVAKSALEAITRYLAQDLGQSNIRFNCISAGPIKTLAAFGIPNFSQFLDDIKAHSPLGININTEDVGNMASFLLSNESRAITGQTLYVDSGMSIIAR
jgi:enoyl-[acyl-carrier protein] reductase I